MPTASSQKIYIRIWTTLSAQLTIHFVRGWKVTVSASRPWPPIKRETSKESLQNCNVKANRFRRTKRKLVLRRGSWNMLRNVFSLRTLSASAFAIPTDEDIRCVSLVILGSPVNLFLNKWMHSLLWQLYYYFMAWCDFWTRCFDFGKWGIQILV